MFAISATQEKGDPSLAIVNARAPECCDDMRWDVILCDDQGSCPRIAKRVSLATLKVNRAIAGAHLLEDLYPTFSRKVLIPVETENVWLSSFSLKRTEKCSKPNSAAASSTLFLPALVPYVNPRAIWLVFIMAFLRSGRISVVSMFCSSRINGGHSERVCPAQCRTCATNAAQRSSSPSIQDRHRAAARRRTLQMAGPHREFLTQIQSSSASR